MTEPRIVVIDDYFPRIATAFRIAEYTWLLDHGVVAEVMSTAEPFEPIREQYAAIWPDAAEKVTRFDPSRLGEFDLGYLMFANNAITFLPHLREASLPFVLTLYPGGGLDLGTTLGTEKLDEIYASGLLRHVITTQPRVTEYLAEHYGTSIPVTEIIGVTLSPVLFQPGAGQRSSYFGSGKETLDLSFVAYKYDAKGRDKGYPQFLDVVRNVRAAGVPVHGHVAGGFFRGDLPDDDLADVLTFYPQYDTSALREFYLGMDVVVSPNAPNLLGSGTFDGFPTGSVVEGALSGVAMLCSDTLQQNRLFRDGRDVLIAEPTAEAMTTRLLALLREPGGIQRVAQAGLHAARRHYSPAAQLTPRAEVLRTTAAAVVERPEEVA